MKIIIGFIIFCLVLFFYLHIYFHLKTSDDMEIYEIETPSKDKIEEICDMRQPFVFPFNNEHLLQSCNRNTIGKLYGAFDVKIRSLNRELEDDEEIYVPISYSNAVKAIDIDNESKYLIENNSDFLQETGLIKQYKENDEYLRPSMVSNCMYDINIASKGARTVFKYNVNYRNYLYVTEGSVKIKLTPPKNSKYLSEIKDYENFEFRSLINPWDIQDKYKVDFDKVNCLDINVTEGNMIFIPAYWWYSIEFGEKTTICSLKYRTYMNTFAILPKLCMFVLQLQNTKHKTLPQIQYDNKVVDNNNKVVDNNNKVVDNNNKNDEVLN